MTLIKKLTQLVVKYLYEVFFCIKFIFIDHKALQQNLFEGQKKALLIAANCHQTRIQLVNLNSDLCLHKKALKDIDIIQQNIDNILYHYTFLLYPNNIIKLCTQRIYIAKLIYETMNLPDISDISRPSLKESE